MVTKDSGATKILEYMLGVPLDARFSAVIHSVELVDIRLCRRLSRGLPHN